MANFTWPSLTSTQGPLKFVLDAATVVVNEDTITPSNNIPLPVKLMGVTGPINVTAGDLNVQLTDVGPNADVTKIGDGTNRLEITASNEAKVSDAGVATALGTLNGKDFATQTTLAAIQTKLNASIAVTGPLTDTQLRAAAVPVSGTFWQATQPVSGTVGVSNFPATQAVTGTFWQATQPVSGPLTDAELRTSPVSVAGTFWQATQPVSAASLPLPTGAATEATLSAASGKLPATLGQKTMANSMAVVLSSDQSAIPVTMSAGTVSKVGLARNDYSSTNVTTSAYVQLIASTASAASELEIFDSSGETLVFAVGAAASEVDQFYISPGGNGRMKLSIPSGSRISIKAVTATASVGYINLSLFS